MRIQIRRRKGTHRKAVANHLPRRHRSKALQTVFTEKDAQACSHRTGVDVMDGIHVADRASVPLRDAARLWLDALEISGLERSTVSQYRSQLRNHILPLLGAVKFSRTERSTSAPLQGRFAILGP